MDLRALIESLQRLYLNPSVGPTTEVRVEADEYRFFSCSQQVKVAAPLGAIAINDCAGRRCIVLSSLPRRDAIAR